MASPTTWWALKRVGPDDPKCSHLAASVLQTLWGAAFSGSAAALYYFQLPSWVGYAIVVVFCAALRWVPDDHNSIGEYLGAVGALPIFLVDYAHRGGAHTFFLLWLILGLLPALDWFVGIDTTPPPKRTEGLNYASFRFVTLVQPFMQLAVFLWAAGHVSSATHLSLLDVVGVSVSVGMYTGAIGITYAHELCHRQSRLDRFLGKFNLVLVGYAHFHIEHNKGHHKHVATDEDPATAHAGETFWHFLPRVIVGELVSAVRLERNRLAKLMLPFFHPSNELFHFFGGSALVAYSLFKVFGPRALLMFVVQCMVAVLLFQSVNYLEHYGLERRQLSEDPNLPAEERYEPVQRRHSWDSPARLTNCFVIKLQRHADHHAAAGKRFQQLEVETSTSPQLPGGYATMILIALFPPIWFAVMDPRLLHHRAKMPPQDYRWYPKCSAAPGKPVKYTQ